MLIPTVLTPASQLTGASRQYNVHQRYNSGAMTVTHQGVKCKTKDCGNLIPQASPGMPGMFPERVEFGGFMEEPKEIRCSRCGQVHVYEDTDLVNFEAPAPAVA